jgi:hypothetical protein
MDYGVLSKRRLDMSDKIGPALGPSAFRPAQSAQRPGTGGMRPAAAPQAGAPRSPIGRRVDRPQLSPAGHAPSAPMHAFGTPAAAAEGPGAPTRPATAHASGKSPQGKDLPARPYTADATPSAPSVPPAPEATMTPEASHLEANTPRAAAAEESPDGVITLRLIMLDESAGRCADHHLLCVIHCWCCRGSTVCRSAFWENRCA